MLFNEFGSKENPPVLLLHGMMQDWHSEYELLKPLEEHYRLIIPAQDGFYDGSGDFTSFADQARQVEGLGVVSVCACFVKPDEDYCGVAFYHAAYPEYVMAVYATPIGSAVSGVSGSGQVLPSPIRGRTFRRRANKYTKQTMPTSTIPALSKPS